MIKKQGLFQKGAAANWRYDGEADVLYISFGKPRAVFGVDVGEGIIVRYDEKAREVVGLTIIGVRDRLERALKKHTKRRLPNLLVREPKKKTRIKDHKTSKELSADVGRALRRAAKTARKEARMHGTPIWIEENGKIIAIKP